MDEKNYQPIFIKKIPSAKIKPNNLLTKLLWRFIKLDVKIEMVDNPIFKKTKSYESIFERLPSNNKKYVFVDELKQELGLE